MGPQIGDREFPRKKSGKTQRGEGAGNGRGRASHLELGYHEQVQSEETGRGPRMPGEELPVSRMWQDTGAATSRSSVLQAKEDGLRKGPEDSLVLDSKPK